MKKLITLFLMLFFINYLNSAYALINIELTRFANNAVPIAVVPFTGQSHDLLENNNVAGVISSDLGNSGLFKLLSLAKMTQFPDKPGEINLAQWREKNVTHMVVGQVDPLGGDRVRVHVALINLFANTETDPVSQIVFNQIFSVSQTQLRSLSHHIADLIFEKLTGKRGIFSTKIAYVAVDRNGGAASYRLEVADNDGHNAKALLISKEPIMSPAWSPDAKQLAYVSFERGHPQIYVQTIATGQRRLITSFSGINGAPEWSPDGHQLVVVLSKSGSPKLYKIDLSDGQLTQLTHGNAIDTEPDWSPDGKSIIFTSNRGGSPQIYQLDLASGQIDRLTYNGRFNARAVFSPNAKNIVFLHRDEQGNFDIAEQNLQSGRFTLLTRSGLEESPSISANGLMILYASSVGKKIQLAIVSSDGRVKLRLPAREGDIQAPAWSPFTS